MTAVPVSTSQIDLSWTASTDNVAVTGYRVTRNGAVIATIPGTSYADTGRAQGTTYTYVVAAFDAAGNFSPDSAPVSATTSTPRLLRRRLRRLRPAPPAPPRRLRRPEQRRRTASARRPELPQRTARGTRTPARS